MSTPAPRATSPRARSLRRNLLIGVGLFLAADLGLVGWLVSPQAPSMTATRQQLAINRTQLVGLRGQAAQLHSLDGRIHESQAQIQQLMAEGMPEENGAASRVLAELDRISTDSGVQVSGADFHPDKNGHLGLRRYAIGIQVAGSYTGAVRFLNQLERSPMLFIIDQVSVTGGKAAAANSAAGGGADLVKLEVQLELYEQSDAPEAPKPGTTSSSGGAQ